MNLSNVYVGTVVNNSDLSEKGVVRPRGMVKVLINGITDTAGGGEEFKFPRGANLNRTLTDQSMDLVEEQEVWATVLQPVMGGGGSMAKYNAESNTAIISDNDFPTTTESQTQAENYTEIIGDGFAASGVGTAGVNPNANSYAPDNRSNLPKGSFAMPDVGDVVLVSFTAGSRSLPTILGILHGVDSIESMYGTGPDGVFPGYPLGYSNIK